ncbi:uncharacterized protein LOC107046474 [Diachasma alloeum]|uniref:uncharacterized protein LOC107046474 n=1 Tax=Diachasma alloeum TaxID=454923 RepID=UPI0007381A89|nr:uncharacterized protein LOC107046474 [Diachasma alloeum]
MKPLLNYDLFYMNGYPMKFYLDGYTDVQIREMAEIIEAFGGKFSKPGENTIVFSYPGAPNSENCDRFDSKFFFDSVTTSQLQKLDNYRLPLTPINTSIETNEDCPLINPETSTATNTHFNDSKDHSEKSDSSKPVSKSTEDDSNHVTSSRIEERLRTTLHTKKKKKKRSKSPSSVDESRVETGKPKTITPSIPYSKEESAKIQKFLAENKTACDLSGVSVWKKMDEAKIFVQPYRSRKSLYSYYCKNLRQNSEKYLRDKCNLDECHKPIEDVHDKTNRKYSKEDGKKIMDYIIKNNLIHYVGGSIVWKQIEAERVLTNPPRTWQSLKSHFKTILRNQIEEYTDDPEVIRVFEVRKQQRDLEFIEQSSKIKET